MKPENSKQARKFVNRAGMIGISRKRMGEDLPVELSPWTEVRYDLNLSKLRTPPPTTRIRSMFSKDELLMMREIIREIDGV